jgi:hypothetical protein
MLPNVNFTPRIFTEPNLNFELRVIPAISA